MLLTFTADPAVLLPVEFDEPDGVANELTLESRWRHKLRSVNSASPTSPGGCAGSSDAVRDNMEPPCSNTLPWVSLAELACQPGIAQGTHSIFPTANPILLHTDFFAEYYAVGPRRVRTQTSRSVMTSTLLESRAEADGSDLTWCLPREYRGSIAPGASRIQHFEREWVWFPAMVW